MAHTGHGDQSRVRGASALEADTDAALIVNRIGTESTVTVDRNQFEGAPEMPPLVYQGDVVDLGRFDDEGRARDVPGNARGRRGNPAAPSPAKHPSERRSRDILRALRNQQKESRSPLVWTLDEMRKIGRDLGQHKSTALCAVESLVCRTGS